MTASFSSLSVAPFDAELFRLRLKSAVAAAIRESGMDRHRIAAEVTILTDRPMSRVALDALTSPSKAVDLSVVRLAALARVLESRTLWNAVLSTEGMVALDFDEGRLKEIERLEEQRRSIDTLIARLGAPASVRG